jgi:excisionase family DNA binding protein
MTDRALRVPAIPAGVVVPVMACPSLWEAFTKAGDNDWTPSDEVVRGVVVAIGTVAMEVRRARASGALPVTSDRLPNPLPRSDDRHMLTTRPAADILGMTQRAVTEACDKGRLPGAEKRGSRWLIPLASVEEWAASR